MFEERCASCRYGSQYSYSRQRLGLGVGAHSCLVENADTMAKESRHSSSVKFRGVVSHS